MITIDFGLSVGVWTYILGAWTYILGVWTYILLDVWTCILGARRADGRAAGSGEFKAQGKTYFWNMYPEQLQYCIYH